MAEDQKKRLYEELTNERLRRKRTREGSSQNDEKDAHEVREHACQRCCDANARLSMQHRGEAVYALTNITRFCNIQEKSKRSGVREQKDAKEY